MDKKSKVIIMLFTILIIILASIFYVNLIYNTELKTVQLNNATIDIPSHVDFKIKNDTNYLLLDSDKGYFVCEIKNTNNTTVSDVQSYFNLEDKDVFKQKGVGENSLKVTIYKSPDNTDSMKYIGIYHSKKISIVVGSPNLDMLNKILESINEGLESLNINEANIEESSDNNIQYTTSPNSQKEPSGNNDEIVEDFSNLLDNQESQDSSFFDEFYYEDESDSQQKNLEYFEIPI